MKQCVVSFVDSEGLRHAVELYADSLYEAAALALKTFRQHDCAPGVASRLEVEVRSAVTHTLTVKRLEDWIAAGSKSPSEAVLKARLKTLLK